MSHSAISMALMAELRIGPPRHRGLRNINCQRYSISVGSWPATSASLVFYGLRRPSASLLVTEPSPSPMSPWIGVDLAEDPIHAARIHDEGLEASNPEIQIPCLGKQ